MADDYELTGRELELLRRLGEIRDYCAPLANLWEERVDIFVELREGGVLNRVIGEAAGCGAEAVIVAVRKREKAAEKARAS